MRALAASSGSDHPLRGTRRPAPPIERSAEDRWLSVKTAKRASALMSFILMASVATHAGLIATAFWADWRERDPSPKEISVEVIQEPAKPPAPKPPPPKPSKASEPQKTPSAAEPEPAKPEPNKGEPPKTDKAKHEPAKATPKPLPQVKPEPKAQPQKAAARKAAAEPKKEPPQGARHQSEADALRKELDSLKTQAALNARHETLKPTPVKMTEPTKAAASGSERFRDLLGTSPLSMGAVALPGESADGTEVVSYKQLVLSKVAKAKKQGSYPGVPGYATIAFLIGDRGEVASSKIERTGGDPSVSQEATDMIARGAPYPAPPPGADRMFVVTLEFKPTR